MTEGKPSCPISGSYRTKDTRDAFKPFRADKPPAPAPGRGPAEGGPRDDFSKLERPLWGAPLWPGHIYRFVTTTSRYSLGTGWREP